MSGEVKDIKWGQAELAKLHVRYIPVVTPTELWHYDMSLKNSPHVELMKIFVKQGLAWDEICNSRYYREREHRGRIGIDKWTEKKIRYHIKERYGIFKSIQRHGIKEKLLKKDPIRVLEKPFWGTRFNLKASWYNGQEVWNGAGRCAAAYVLGCETIPVLWCKDKYPSTGKRGKFESKLRNVKGVWND
jgi:hypothetical protein